MVRFSFIPYEWARKQKRDKQEWKKATTPHLFCVFSSSLWHTLHIQTIKLENVGMMWIWLCTGQISSGSSLSSHQKPMVDYIKVPDSNVESTVVTLPCFFFLSFFFSTKLFVKNERTLSGNTLEWWLQKTQWNCWLSSFVQRMQQGIFIPWSTSSLTYHLEFRMSIYWFIHTPTKTIRIKIL